MDAWEQSHSNQDFAQVSMITRELQVSITSGCKRLDAAELIAERVLVKKGRFRRWVALLQVAGSSELQVCPSPVRFQASGISSPFFFLFLNPNSQCYKPHLRSRRWLAFPHSSSSTRHFIKGGLHAPTRYHLNPRGMAAITRGVDK